MQGLTEPPSVGGMNPAWLNTAISNGYACLPWAICLGTTDGGCYLGSLFSCLGNEDFVQPLLRLSHLCGAPSHQSLAGSVEHFVVPSAVHMHRVRLS